MGEENTDEHGPTQTNTDPRTGARAGPCMSVFVCVRPCPVYNLPAMPSRRLFPPEPAVTGETKAQRWRRKRRTYVLRWFDRAILSLYRLIHWLDRRAPIERRYFRVAIFGSSRIQPDDEAYLQV